MSRTAMLGALGCAFVLGCVAASTAIVPAYAQQPSARKWEQFCSYRMTFAMSQEAVTLDVNGDLKAKGDAGWELTAVAAQPNFIQYCFKRPAP